MSGLRTHIDPTRAVLRNNAQVVPLNTPRYSLQQIDAIEKFLDGAAGYCRTNMTESQRVSAFFSAPAKANHGLTWDSTPVNARGLPVLLADKELWDVEDQVKRKIDRQHGGHEISLSTKRYRDMLQDGLNSSPQTSPTTATKGVGQTTITRQSASPSSSATAGAFSAHVSESSKTLSARASHSPEGSHSEHGLEEGSATSPKNEGQQEHPKGQLEAATLAPGSITTTGGVASDEIPERPTKHAKRQPHGKSETSPIMVYDSDDEFR